MVGPDGLPAVIQKTLATRGDSETLKTFSTNRPRYVYGRRRATTMEGCHDQGAAQEERQHGVWKLSWHLPGGARRHNISQSSRPAPVTTANGRKPYLRDQDHGRGVTYGALFSSSSRSLARVTPLIACGVALLSFFWRCGMTPQCDGKLRRTYSIALSVFDGEI